jgi:hypothetical protein
MYGIDDKGGVFLRIGHISASWISNMYISKRWPIKLIFFLDSIEAQRGDIGSQKSREMWKKQARLRLFLILNGMGRRRDPYVNIVSI